jgi:hypothetical protein
MESPHLHIYAINTIYFCILFLYILTRGGGHALAQLVEALRYKSEGRGFDSPMVSLEFFIDRIPWFWG